MFYTYKQQLLIINSSYDLKNGMKTIATVDLKHIHEFYNHIKVNYPEYSQLFLYFFAACLHLDTNVSLETALK